MEIRGRNLRAKAQYAVGRNYRIIDPAGLARVLRGAIDQRFDGSVIRASRETGVKRALLRRLLNAGAGAPQSALRHDSVQSLRRLVRQDWQRLEATLYTAAARDMMTRFNRWLDAATEFAECGTLASSDGRIREGRHRNAAGHAQAVHVLLLDLQREYPKEWSPLTAALTNKHTRERARLAFARVVSPLVDYYDSGGIEIHPDELSDEDLRAFIKAGVKREVLLLQRDNDRRRAQDGDRLRPVRRSKARAQEKLAKTILSAAAARRRQSRKPR